MHVRLTSLDSKLPNLAMMRLSTWHKRRGDTIHFTTSPVRARGEDRYDRVYCSVLFDTTKPKLDRFKLDFPDAILGGTGSGKNKILLEDVAPGIDAVHELDYTLYPDFRASIGFSQRGCRLDCKFCAVPWLEGRPREASPIYEIWRGPGHPKILHLLDNDFFGVPSWEAKLETINHDGFRVCFSQGINIRLINQRIARAIASTRYSNYHFNRRRLYAAWDNLGQESVVMRGLDYLEAAGVPAKNVMIYMLVGFAPGETWEQILYRFGRLRDRGCMPYPMPWFPGFGAAPEALAHYRRLKQFQRWVVTGTYEHVHDFADYDPSKKGPPRSKPKLAPLPLLDRDPGSPTTRH